MALLVASPKSHAQAKELVARGKPYCWAVRMLGAWYRRGRHGEKQQFNAYPDGYTSYATFDPTTAGGTAGADIADQPRTQCNFSQLLPKAHLPVGASSGVINIRGARSLGYPYISDHGQVLDFLDDNGKTVFPNERRFERAFEPPPVDWKQRLRDGGYPWDFAHVCPANARRELDPMLSATWKALVDHDFHPRYIRLGMQFWTHKMLWAEGPLDAPMIPTDYCTPNDHTLVLGVPGPRGTTIPKAYDLMIEDSLSSLFINGYEAFQR